MSRRILVVAHNHPDLHPGGTEIFAHDLFGAYKRAGAEALFLGATNRIHRKPHPGTSFQAIGDAEDEILLWSGHFDRFFLNQIDLYGTIPDLISLLEDFRPDVVHIHHLLLIGAEFPFLVRRILPHARIVMTLHDYYPICAHDGLLMKPDRKSPCAAFKPGRLCDCLPDIPSDRYRLREQHLKTMFQAIDRFIAPSAFLKERYVAWGLAADRIEVIHNGRPAATPVPHRPAADGKRVVFGYFGNLNPWKGATVLLKAAKLLIDAGVDFELRIHGGAPFQSDDFVAEFESLAKAVEPLVMCAGPYQREELPALMGNIDWIVMPSIWWENAPLVIQEAQIHRRPVITSGIGGMAEAVRDGIDGLHVPPGDAAQLARTMLRAIEDPDLWRRLVAGIRQPSDIDAVAQRHLAVFEDLKTPAVAA